MFHGHRHAYGISDPVSRVNLLSAFLCGLLFSLGLGISGMTRPEKVLGFLDISGHWDGTLALVMGSAVAVTWLLFPYILRQPRPRFTESFKLPKSKSIDNPLLLGSAIFGIGWGLAGFCPGPALVSLATGSSSVILFTTAMFAGFYLQSRLPWQ
jgi:uncharacterized protein